MLTVETTATLAEAATRLGQGARFMAGGTLVMRDANFARAGFDRIVRAQSLPGDVRTEGDRLVLGAGLTMTGVIRAPDLAFLAPVAQRVGGPAVRNMATVGGNLFAPHPYGDFASALLALDGRARMAGGGEMALDELLARRDSLGQLVEAVSIARPQGESFRFAKMSRVKPKGVSVISIAAWLPGAPGRISGARIAFGAMGPAPQRAKAAEQALEGASLDATGIAPALAAATQGLTPPDDALASAWYRAEVAPVLLRRVLLNEGGR